VVSEKSAKSPSGKGWRVGVFPDTLGVFRRGARQPLAVRGWRLRTASGAGGPETQGLREPPRRKSLWRKARIPDGQKVGEKK
jgi:hypothetical protein